MDTKIYTGKNGIITFTEKKMKESNTWQDGGPGAPHLALIYGAIFFCFIYRIIIKKKKIRWLIIERDS